MGKLTGFGAWEKLKQDEEDLKRGTRKTEVNKHSWGDMRQKDTETVWERTNQES